MLNRGFHSAVSVIHDEVRSEICITCSSIDCEKQMQHYKRCHACYADGFSGSDEAEREKKKTAFTPGINIQCVCGYPVWQERGTHVNAQCLQCQITSGGVLASHCDITSVRRQCEQCDQQLLVYVKKKAQ